MVLRPLTEPFRRGVAAMRGDLAAARERDPAARGTLELVTCYPGLHALWLHRAAHRLHTNGLRLPARLLSQASRFLTGIEIHPGAEIGPGCFIDHGMGVVIGETTQIGRDVTLYQSVTLGGTGKDTGKRHPTIGDGATVGTGAKILGPVNVGAHAKVGAGAIVVKDVPERSTVVGNPGKPVVVDGRRVDGPDLEHTRLPDPVAEALACLVARIGDLERDIAQLRQGRVPPERPERGDCIPDDLRAVLGLNGANGNGRTVSEGTPPAPE